MHCPECAQHVQTIGPEFHPDSDVGPWDSACPECGHVGHHPDSCTPARASAQLEHAVTSVALAGRELYDYLRELDPPLRNRVLVDAEEIMQPALDAWSKATDAFAKALRSPPPRPMLPATPVMDPDRDYALIRADIRAALDGWGTGERSTTGDFLHAVLSNDLSEAVARADRDNVKTLPAIVSYVMNELPSECHGSPERYAAWQAAHTPGAE